MPSDTPFIKIATDAAALPEDLLMAQAAGKVVFLAGAGVSMGDPARLPDFRQLVREVYKKVDPSVAPYLENEDEPHSATVTRTGITPEQRAEVSRFHRRDSDVTLGMLERRLEGDDPQKPSAVRAAVRELLSSNKPTPAHRALIRLSERDDATAILTTNFDLLFERCPRRPRQSRPTYGLGGMPRPSTRKDFTGVFHIHGALPTTLRQPPDILLTDRDFGEHYFRRRFVPDFLYDVSRLYCLVLVGYSADDPPMRYLLNAIAADTIRFSDLKPRYIFVSGENTAHLSDLRSRGLIPIPYSSSDHHEELTITLRRWASIAPLQRSQRHVRSIIRKAVRVPATDASSSDKNLVSHLVKRATETERRDLAAIAGKVGHPSWLTHMHSAISAFYRADAERRQRTSYEITFSFLRDRLRNLDNLEWATTDSALDSSIREAISVLIDNAPTLPASWKSAWQWIRDSWSSPHHGHSFEEYRIANRVRDGDRSESLVHSIARLVEPPLRVEMHSPFRRALAGPGPMRTLWIHFGEVEFVTLADLHLDKCTDPAFLLRVTHALDGQLTRTMDLLPRLSGAHPSRQASNALLLGLYATDRLNALRSEDRSLGSGAAPLIHLLYTLLRHLSSLDCKAARRILRTWQDEPTFLHRRLWSSLAMNEHLVTGPEVGKFLRGISQAEFWDAESYPEIADLRANRFTDLTPEDQRTIASKLRRHSPRFPGLRDLDATAFSEHCERRTFGEFRRITKAGGQLLASDLAWMMSRTHIETVRERSGGRELDTRFDLINDEDLLRALDAALGEDSRRSPEGDYDVAAAWIGTPANWPRLIQVLEAALDGAAAYGHVWNSFALHHRPLRDTESLDELDQARRVLSMLADRSLKSVNRDIFGICRWFSQWKSVAIASVDGVRMALKYWDRAVEASNRQYAQKGAGWTKAGERGTRRWDSDALETSALNNPAGELAAVLVDALPELDDYGPAGDALNLEIRNALVAPRGHFAPLGRWYLARRLSYLWSRDKDWTRHHVVEPMLDAQESDLSLWIGFVRESSRVPFREILEYLGPGILERASDSRLDLRVRQSLATLAVEYLLLAFWGDWEPKLSEDGTRQMLRAAEVDLLVHVIDYGLLRFLRLGPAPAGGQEERVARAARFRRSIKPVLRKVWPQERIRDRPRVGKAMAQIPAAAGSAFVDAYHTVERFLCPFRVYTIRDYGFGPAQPRGQVFDWMESRAEAEALLSLLDLTVGEGEEAQAPLDVDEALERIRTVSPPLAQEPAFRRLQTLQRRSPLE